MAALTSLATVAGAGATLLGVARNADAQREANRAQTQLSLQQEAARREELAAQQAASAAGRAQALERTVAAARARLAAGGIAPDDGSAEALTTGLRTTAAEAAGGDEAVLRARLARGRASLLNPDGTLTALLQSGRTFGVAARSLLD